MAAGSTGVLSAVGVASGIALIAAACWPNPRRWVLLGLILLGTVPFAALAWTAPVPVLLMLVTAAVAVQPVRETGPAGAWWVSVPSGSGLRPVAAGCLDLQSTTFLWAFRHCCRSARLGRLDVNRKLVPMSRLTITTLFVAGTQGGSANAQVSAPLNRIPSASARAPLHNRMLVRLLRSRLHRLVDGSVVALRVRGVVTGSMHELPVMYAVDSTGYVVYPGRPDTKRWWRNLRRPAQVMLLHGGCWQGADGVLLRPGAAGYEGALHAYQQRWPKVAIRPADALVHVRVTEPLTAPSTSRRSKDR